jgi:Cu+-exporting ATPase
VYQILNENKLYKYYDLDKTPGIRVEPSEHKAKYDYLEKEEIASKLIRFREGDTAKVVLYIPAIHCASCIWLLEHLNTLNRGIRHSLVNFAKKEVSITFNQSEISLRDLIELLDSIHYIPDISASIEGLEDRSKSDKSLLYKIGVAGFAFINVMTYSLPAYFNGKPLDDELNTVFTYLSYALVIPVVIYSARDYFISSFKNTRKGVVSIDLPIALGILVLFVVTSYDVFFNTNQGYCDSLSGLVFFLLVGKWYQGKSYEALSFDRDYKSYFPVAVTKILGNAEENILLEQVEPGDEILIRNKELIPTDSVITEGEAVIDYSFVTGEATPVRKKAGDFVYAGGRQLGGIIRVIVKQAVDQSHLTKLWNQDSTYTKNPESIKTLSDKISKKFTLIVLSVAILGFTGWALFGDFKTAIYVFTSVLIVACPCALVLSIPFTFGNTMHVFGKNGLYIKNTDVIEKLSQIDTIVFDKTGTITDPNNSRTEYTGRKLTPEEELAIFSLSRQSTHPLSNAISEYYQGGNYIQPEYFTEAEGRGILGKAGGFEIRYGLEEFVNQEAKSENGKTTEVHLSINGQMAGVYRFRNAYRDGFEEVINSIKPTFNIYLLSGDNDSEKEHLSAYFPPGQMFFNMKPQDKAEFIVGLQKLNKRVLMTGDGLNDAGALMQSDVALSVASKVYHFSPASDAVLEAGRFHLLAQFIRFTRTSRKIVKASFIISFFYNLIGISIALSGRLSPVVAAILMPLSSVSVVAFATFTTLYFGKLRFRKTIH